MSVPLPVGAGPRRFFVITVSCEAMPTLLSELRAGGKVEAPQPALEPQPIQEISHGLSPT